jgi:hypothetical protein
MDRGNKKKMIKPIAVILFFLTGVLHANDFRWNFINALIRSDHQTAESLVNHNIDRLRPIDKRSLVNITITYSRGETTLRVLELLLRHNIRPSSFDLFTAINRNHTDDVILHILRNGGQANGEILLLAMERQRFNFARYFINTGVDVNYQYSLSRHDSDGMTPLLHAAAHNNYELVRILVEHGANINVRNRAGSSALSIAQNNENMQIIDFLLERGATQSMISPLQHLPQQTGGIASFMDSREMAFQEMPFQEIAFQPGTYRLSAGNRDLRFTGNANFGNVSFTSNNRTYNGSYQISGAAMTLIMEGRTFVYRIDSGISFSGNGEVWVRIAN